MSLESINEFNRSSRLNGIPLPPDSPPSTQKSTGHNNHLDSFYKSSIASCSTNPLWPQTDPVDYAINPRSLPPVEETVKKGIFDKIASYATSSYDWVCSTVKSIYDTAYTYIWGTSPYNKANIDAEIALSEAQIKRIADALDAMIKALERIQEIAKEEGTDAANSEDREKYFSFIEILKQDAILLKRQLTDHVEAMSIAQKDIKENLQRSSVERAELYKASDSADIAQKFLNVTNFFVGATALFNTVEVWGICTINPQITALGRAGAITSMAASGASRLAKTTFDNRRIKHELEIETLTHLNRKIDFSIKNMNQDIRVINQNIAIPDNYIAELIKSLETLKNSMLDYK